MIFSDLLKAFFFFFFSIFFPVGNNNCDSFPLCTHGDGTRSSKRDLEISFNGSGHFSHNFMWNYSAPSFKDNSKNLNNSLKSHLSMQNQLRAVCTEYIMPSHIMFPKASQTESVDWTTDSKPSTRIPFSFCHLKTSS